MVLPRPTVTAPGVEATSRDRDQRLPGAVDPWAEPPYEILCPLEWHEVSDLSRWDHVYPAPKMERGLYLCQPLVGIFREIGTNRTPCWMLALRVMLGPDAEKVLLRTFWLSERAREQSTADLRRLGLPLSIARQTVEFDRGGVMAVVDLRWNEHDRDLPYTISSMRSLKGIRVLHNKFLDYQRATSERPDANE